jgi:hypothetical protein
MIRERPTFLVSIAFAWLALAVASSAVGAGSGAIVIAIEGDSRTAPPSPTTNFWPSYWQTSSPLAGKAVVFTNFALGGDTLESMVSEYDTQAHAVRPTTNQVGYFILCGGGNDLGTGMNASGSRTYAYATQLWAKARADGYRVVASTDAGAMSWPASNKVQSAAFNALVRSNTNLYDFLLEPDIHLPVSDTRLYIEGTHFTDLGSLSFARMLNAVLTGSVGAPNK